jgi:hypothetical protein
VASRGQPDGIRPIRASGAEYDLERSTTIDNFSAKGSKPNGLPINEGSSSIDAITYDTVDANITPNDANITPHASSDEEEERR